MDGKNVFVVGKETLEYAVQDVIVSLWERGIAQVNRASTSARTCLEFSRQLGCGYHATGIWISTPVGGVSIMPERDCDRDRINFYIQSDKSPIAVLLLNPRERV